MENFYQVDNVKHLRKLRELRPDLLKGFLQWTKEIFKDGALPAKVKQLMAIVAAHITQCPWCIQEHTQRAKELGATEEELAETIFVAMAMGAGAAFSHGCISLAVFEEHSQTHK